MCVRALYGNIAPTISVSTVATTDGKWNPLHVDAKMLAIEVARMKCVLSQAEWRPQVVSKSPLDSSSECEVNVYDGSNRTRV